MVHEVFAVKIHVNNRIIIGIHLGSLNLKHKYIYSYIYKLPIRFLLVNLYNEYWY